MSLLLVWVIVTCVTYISVRAKNLHRSPKTSDTISGEDIIPHAILIHKTIQQKEKKKKKQNAKIMSFVHSQIIPQDVRKYARVEWGLTPRDNDRLLFQASNLSLLQNVALIQVCSFALRKFYFMSVGNLIATQIEILSTSFKWFLEEK